MLVRVSESARERVMMMMMEVVDARREWRRVIGAMIGVLDKSGLF